MTTKGSNDAGKGFSGLSGLSGRTTAPMTDDAEATQAPVETPSPPPVAPVARVESKTAAPTWPKVVVIALLGMIAFAVIVALNEGPTSSQADSAADAAAAATAAQAAADAAYAASDTSGTDPWQAAASGPAATNEAAVADAAQAAADAASAAANAASSGALAASVGAADSLEGEQRPDLGVDQELYAPQIRYCVREKIRLDAADSAVDTSDGSSVDRFNAMVNDYNGRCGSFRYRVGVLEPIQREAEAMRYQLETEGRGRFPNVRSAIEPTSAPDLSDTSLSNAGIPGTDESSLDSNVDGEQPAQPDDQ